ncbi:hypothetical protein IE53DRAFT_387511 [Violaceomyces palustris]|uniref:Uncharacterized protein n=1 Tax=Violaceomyces palustris TaxID=1673888 RepID=A0ACD0NWI9_9BASI|nr:hypothetical protein IE53DRAFT_387511 [Violaceomyces palustris]
MSSKRVPKPRGEQRPSDHKSGPKGEPMTPIPSATLVVLCPRRVNDRSSKGSSILYETLMVQRSARDGSSFRSAVVFPGGALDLADERAVGSVPLKPLENLEDETKYMSSLKLCALRETFEETGLLLIPSGWHSNASSPATVGSPKDRLGPPRSRAIGHEEAGMTLDEWNEIRADVHDDASYFVPFLRKVASKLGFGDHPEHPGLLPEIAPMVHHSNWITPRSVLRPAKRFDAHFFITVLDRPNALVGDGTGGGGGGGGGGEDGKGSTIELSADGTETLSLRLASPEHLMRLALADEIALFPPQFYILADLHAALTSSEPCSLAGIRPLIFDGSSSDPNRGGLQVEARITPVEEEARGLQGRNYSWDRREVDAMGEEKQGSAPAPLTSWISDSEPPLGKAGGSGPPSPVKITAVEPRPFPKLGSMVTLNRDGTAARKGENPSGDEDDTHEPFVFPLVLPGDYQASHSQRERARKGSLVQLGRKDQTMSKRSDDNDDEDPVPARGRSLNRLYVSPRSKSQGGGMTVRGAIRRGVGDLRDFEVGLMLQEKPREDEDEEDADFETSKPKL